LNLGGGRLDFLFIQNLESVSVIPLETSGHVVADPFPWSHEEFDSGTSTVAQMVGLCSTKFFGFIMRCLRFWNSLCP